MSSPQVTFDQSTFQPLQQSQLSGSASGGVSFDTSTFQPLQGQQQPQQPQLDLTNPQGQGLYQMTDATGKVVGVPYGKVSQAASQFGHQFANDQERWRYNKDNAADPNRTTSFQATPNEQTPEGHKAAVYAREDAAPAVMQPVIGVGKAGGTIFKPVGDMVIDPLSGNDDPTDYTEARNTGQKVGKYGTMAALAAGSAAVAPGATIVGTAGGMTGGAIGQIVGPHLGLNPKQTAILSDILTLAGGIGGGMAGESVATAGSAAAGAAVPRIDPKTFVADEQEYRGVSPVDIKADQLASKSGIDRGEYFPSPEVPAANLHGIMLDIAGDTAKDAGVDYKGWDPSRPQTIKAPRDIFGEASRNILDKAKVDYQALDAASGGRWQRYSDQIENITRKMNEVSGIDDDAYANLETKRNDIAIQQAQMVEDMKAAGQVDPAIADRAQSLYRQGMALDDVNKAVQASIDRTPSSSGQVVSTVNPEKLGFRLAKLNDIPVGGGPSRLEQAVGPERAASLIDCTDDVINQIAKLKLTKFSATGQAALGKIIADNSASNPGIINKSRITTDWSGVMKDFNDMTPAEKQSTFGNEFNQVARFVRDRAWSHRARSVGAYAAKRLAVPAAVGGGYELIKHAFD